ncbi:aromatic ring-hydroxylating oxygenase subunit alpha [Azospirillum himalayense]|uniref:Aromatic ring-hydroxylating dioxygenase subunit alpha n=1 Tax=Azospirillum himalayense TaxID=654847 RepID=A0ABW0GA00_9PROT
MTITPDMYERLVNVKTGEISREIFVNDEIYTHELERIFTRAWLLVGHESLIPNPDDFFVSRMGNDSVILTRDRQNNIHVLLNSCMHRGMKVCRYDQGNTRSFSCPYHGWSYSTDGRLVEAPGQLVGVPGFEEHYRCELDKKAWGLVRCPNVVNHKGTIWASWDENAPSFHDYLGDMRLYLDAALDHRDGTEGGSEVIGGVQKWRVKCNWKFAVENFIGDHYHNISHRSVDLVGIGPSAGRGRRDMESTGSFQNIIIGFPALGHGVIGHLPRYEEPPYAPAYQRHPAVQEYDRQVYEARVKRLGNKMRVATGAASIFPNMSFHGRQPRTLAVFHPISATEMEMWRFYLVDKDAPQEVKDVLRHYYLRYSGPGGLTESDDMENWMYASEASRGTIARRHPYNYQMGNGYAKPVEGLKGAVQGGDTTEENARILYNRWAQFMAGKSWSELMPAQSV